MVTQGGYGFWDVYEMPVRTREYMIKKLSDNMTEKNNQIAANQNKAREHTTKDIKTLKERLQTEPKKTPPAYITKKAPDK